jgi:hypothetical protein
MKRVRWYLAGLLFAGLAAGCDKKPTAVSTPTPARKSMEGMKERGNIRSDSER